MANRLLSGVSACVFDAYGTLFDFASAARSCADVLGDQVERVSALWRDKQLQYTWLRAAQGRHADFWLVTGDALDFTIETLGLEQPSLRERLMALYLALEPFPEVPGVLATLRQAGLKTAILSNGTPAMLDAVVRRAGLGAMFDDISQSRKLGSSSRTLASISWPWIASAVRRPRLRFSPQMPGTPTQLRRSVCKWCGATATARGANGCRARRIARSRHWWISPH